MKTTQEILEEVRKMRRSWTVAPTSLLLDAIASLADRVAALESREDVRDRIEPIMRGDKPRTGA